MNVLKIHLLVTIVATQLVALFYERSSVPYFPIEISRTAASGPLALGTFRIGIGSLILSLVWTGHVTHITLGLWVCLSTVALFDDVSNWTHMVGVAGIFLHMALQALSNEPLPILGALVIYCLRFALDMVTLIVYEDCPLSPTQLAAKHKEIMYNGAPACKRPDVTLQVYRLGGVMQWIAFYSLSLGL